MREILRHSLRLLTLLLLAFVQFWMPCCQTVSAVDDSWQLYQDMIYYAVTPRNEVIIKSARASVTEAVLPAEIDGCPVTEIASYAFKDCTRLTTVTLPETVQKIGAFAFKDCTRLENLTIPDTVGEIGWGAVLGTLWLKQRKENFVIAGQGILLAYAGTDAQVTVPEGVRAIGGYAFNSCDMVETITLPSTLVSIDAFAFDNCKGLRQITIPDGVETIGEYAFHWCISLREIQLPDSVRSVDGHAFQFCKALETVTLSNAMTQINNTLFQGCSSLVSVQIPDSVSVIYNYAFQNCTALKNVEIPASVTEIGSNVFDGCTALEKLSILNPQCRIYDAERTIEKAANIYGMAESTAHVYAQKYTRAFVPMDRIRGDVDGDGKLTAQDAYEVLLLYAQMSVGTEAAWTDIQLYVADYDENGIVDGTDAYEILVTYAKQSVSVQTNGEEK
ncbi:leucine-rich repeat protein [uncultured Ruminococcus sp.]|uniref:leucine-rich repeat protein n=1 Tax=uncultured Ruminococcus sp. TaxID=165186 RepID=UPI0026079095|nr:leucine-rich repeat protein [uncultured Ruminococcus sp.]